MHRTGSTSNFGVGLPVATKNEYNWPIMQPLLADTSMQPGRDLILLSRYMGDDAQPSNGYYPLVYRKALSTGRTFWKRCGCDTARPCFDWRRLQTCRQR